MGRLVPYLALALMSFAPVRGRAYVLDFPENGEGAASECLFYPVNCRMWAADFIGVRAALLRENPDAPGVYYTRLGPRWSGSTENGMASIWLYVDGRAKASFRNGHLVAFEREEGVGNAEKDRAMLVQKIPPKARTKAIRNKADHRNDGKGYWAKSGRLRLWYSNPNAAGTLFAELALLAVAGVLYLRRKWLKAVCGIAAVGLSVGIVFTRSRGSMAVLLFGIAVLMLPFVMGIRRQALRRMLLIGYVVVFAAAALIAPRLSSAAAHHDLSSAQRLNIWADAPRMMVVAPDGWRMSTGYAWCEWFQPLNGDFTTTWMVNSHLSWLALYGRIFRFAYVAGWLFAFGALLMALICGRERTRKVQAVALSQCGGLFIAMWFSTVGPFPEFWVVPSVAFLLSFVFDRPSVRRLSLLVAAAALFSAIVVYGIEAYGRMAERDAPFGGMVERTQDGVKIGKGDPKVFLVHDNMVLTGGHSGTLGKDIREYYRRHPDAPAMYVSQKAFKGLPDHVDTLVLAGRAADSYLARCRKVGKGNMPFSPRRLVLLSPVESWEKVPEWMPGETSLRYVTGEFAARCFELSGSTVPEWVTVVPEAAVYVRDWTERINE